MQNFKGAQRGKLIQVLPSGSTITLMDNQPWAALQEAKKMKIQAGVDTHTLKITHLR